MVLFKMLILSSSCSSGSSNFGGGGQETWNISRRARWPSFFGLFFTGQGWGHGPLGPPGSATVLTIWAMISNYKFVRYFNRLLNFVQHVQIQNGLESWVDSYLWKIEVDFLYFFSLGTDFCDSLIDFRNEFRNIYKITNVTKYRSFQYRLLQRGLVTNIQLEKWNILTTNLCSFCKNVTETVVHLLCQCTVVRELWNDLSSYIQDRFGQVVLTFEAENILLNRICPYGRNHVANFICLITKQYIYSQRCQGLSLHFPVLKGKIDQIQNIEKYIAIKNNRLGTHFKKWQGREVSQQSTGDFICEYMDGLVVRLPE